MQTIRTAILVSLVLAAMCCGGCGRGPEPFVLSPQMSLLTDAEVIFTGTVREIHVPEPTEAQSSTTDADLARNMLVTIRVDQVLAGDPPAQTIRLRYGPFSYAENGERIRNPAIAPGTRVRVYLWERLAFLNTVAE